MNYIIIIAYFILEHIVNHFLSKTKTLEEKQIVKSLIFDFSVFIYQFTLGIKANNIEVAITGYNNLSDVFTQDNSPEQWADIQNNLAISYSQRIKGNRDENLERAISYYEDALTVYTSGNFTTDWRLTQLALGNIYYQRIKGDRAENLEKAIQFYQNALAVKTRKDFPLEWAVTQNDLATVYCVRIRGNKAENIERAISCFNQALTIRTQIGFPVEWAATQNNLALSYSKRIKGDKVNNCKKAIAYYENALTVYSPQKFPIECLQTSRNLGNLAIERENWQLAINSYSLAIEAVDISCSWATDTQRKQEILSDAIEVYQNMIQACINSGQIERAIEYVERSKAKDLVEFLATPDLYPQGKIPQQVIDRLECLRQKIVVEEKCLSQQNRFGKNLDRT